MRHEGLPRRRAEVGQQCRQVALLARQQMGDKIEAVGLGHFRLAVGITHKQDDLYTLRESSDDFGQKGVHLAVGEVTLQCQRVITP